MNPAQVLNKIEVSSARDSLLMALLEQADTDPSRICQLERECFGVDHCQAGAELTELWKFPPALCEIAATHHEPATGERFLLRDVIRLARIGFDAKPEALADWIAVKINSFEICCRQSYRMRRMR